MITLARTLEESRFGGPVWRVRSALSTEIAIIVVLAAQMIPPLPQYLGLATSMTLGTMMAAGGILLVSLLNAVLPRPAAPFRLADMDVTAPAIVLVTSLVIALHGIVADTIQSFPDVLRAVSSVLPFTLLVAGGIVLGTELRRCPDATMDRALRVSFWALCGLSVLHLIGLQPRGHVFPKSTFPFTEISHFALAFLPVLLYRTVRASPRTRHWWLLGGAAIAMILQSLSLLVGCVIAAAACRRLLPLVLLGGGALLAALPFLELSYFTDRLNFTGDVVNLSNLAYVQGWQLVMESWVNTSGWGIGFQQLGMGNTQVPASEAIRTLTGGTDTNLTDGGFVLAKVVSEFGALGVLVVLGYIVLAVRCTLQLRNVRSDAAVTLARCVIVTYSVDMFFRGTGYFTQSGLVFIAALAVLAKSRVASSRERSAVSQQQTAGR